MSRMYIFIKNLLYPVILIKMPHVLNVCVEKLMPVSMFDYYN